MFLSHAVPGYRPAANPTLLALSAPGYLGVDVFFILSGFILALVYGDLVPRGAAGFLTRRLFRVYPLNIALMIYVALNAWAHDRLNTGWFDMHYFVPYLLMIETLLPGPAYLGWLPTNWSVGVELILYLMFPFAAVALRRAPRSVLWAALAALVVAECIVQHIWLARADGLPAFLRGAVAFFLGAAMAALWRTKAAPRAVMVATLELAPFALATLCLVQHRLWPVPLCAAVSIGALAWQAGPLARLLSTRPAVWVGEISYSIYLVHGLILGDWAGVWLAALRGGLPEPFSTLTWGLLISGTTLVASALTYYIVERPARALGSRLANHWPGPPSMRSPASGRAVP